MTLKDYESIAIMTGSVVALITFTVALSEYIRQGKIKRVEFFLHARSRLTENEKFRKIITLLEVDSKELVKIEFKDKLEFVGFFEEVALLVNSKIIRPEVAQYMFGYYALKCWGSKNFWITTQKELDKNDPYWGIFRVFVSEMQNIAKKEDYSKSKYKL